jgi:hypothetical protein
MGEGMYISTFFSGKLRAELGWALVNTAMNFEFNVRNADSA